MKLNKTKIIFIVLTLILTLFSSFAFAIEFPEDDCRTAIQKWLSGSGGFVVQKTEYTGQDQQSHYAYTFSLPKASVKNNRNGVYQDDNGQYHYQFKDESTNTMVDIVLNMTVEVKFNGQPLDVSGIVATTDEKYKFVINGIETISTSGAFGIGEDVIRIMGPDGEYGPEMTLKQFEKGLSFSSFTFTPGAVTYRSLDGEELPDGPEVEWGSGGRPTLIIDNDGQGYNAKKYTVDKLGLIDFFKRLIKAVKDFIKDILSRIFSFLVLLIGDGLKALIDYAVGENVTLSSIIFNHTKKTTIDFWNIPVVSNAERQTLTGDAALIQNSVAGIMKPVVSFWFIKLRGIAVLCYFVLLLYLGLRIILASTALDLQKLKERLGVWLSGFLVLIFFPYAMKAVVDINNATIKAIEQKGVSTAQMSLNEEQGLTVNTMSAIREAAGANHSVPLAITYIIMLVQLIIFIYIYYKRAFMIGFLITVFPVICVKNLFDNINTSKRHNFKYVDERVLCACIYTGRACGGLFNIY